MNMWTKRTGKHCYQHKYESGFPTLAAAQAFCLEQGPTECSGVYDTNCDGKDGFYACKIAAFKHSSAGSCVYTPPKGTTSSLMATTKTTPKARYTLLKRKAVCAQGTRLGTYPDSVKKC